MFLDAAEAVEPDVNEKKKVLLTDEEKKEYGQRFPKGYKRMKLLGKGGVGVVWLAVATVDGNMVAIK